MRYLTLFLRNPAILPIITLALNMAGTALGQTPGSPEQDTVTNADGSASITIETPHVFAPVFLAGDSYSSAFTLAVQPAHQGQEADLYLAGTVDGNWFIKTPGGWLPWDPAATPPIPYSSTVLDTTVTLSAVDDEPLPAGDFEVHAAYQVGSLEPVISGNPLRFKILPTDGETLHPFASAADMEAYLKQGLQSSSANQVYALDVLVPGAQLEDSTSGSTRVSTTNLQEAGVDEADSVKTDGEHLYILRNCGPQSCLVSYRLDAAEPAAIELASIELSGSLPADGMYLVEEEGSAGDPGR